MTSQIDTANANTLDTPENLELLRKAIKAQQACWDAVRELEIALVGEDNEFKEPDSAHIEFIAASVPGDDVNQSDVRQLLMIIEKSSKRGLRPACDEP